MWRRVGICAVGLALWAAPALAQDGKPWTGLVFGAEVVGTVSPGDTTAFFNYTSYEENLMRVLRVRGLAEWRLPSRWQVLGEVRTDNQRVSLPYTYVRWQPSARAPLFVQAGRLPSLMGSAGRRAYGTDTLVASVPLAYQYLLSLRPDASPASIEDLWRMRGRGWLSSFPLGSTVPAAGLPLIAADEGAVGAQVHWTGDRYTAAVGVTAGAPATPGLSTNDGIGWSARVSTSRPIGLTVGASAGGGRWLDEHIGPANGRRSQLALGADVEFARGHWLARAEVWRVSFRVPTLVPALNALSAFGEVRYRWRPRWTIAARLDRLHFDQWRTPDRQQPWEAAVWRTDVMMGWRARRGLELRAGWQQNWRDGGRVRRRGVPVFQGVLWF